MLGSRVIPCLLLSNSGLVKTTRFGAAKYVGDPINTVKIFNDKEVDELILLDIEASKRRSEPNYQLISEIVSECFMPVCFGGGVSSVDQAIRLIQLGIEKIAVNSAAITNPELITELADVLGTQSVVAGIDVKKDWLGRYRVLDSSTGKLTDRTPVARAEELVRAGAGEIFLNNADRDGTREGYDLSLISRMSNAASIPLIACGGGGCFGDLGDALAAGASAAAAGSMFVFQGKHRAVLLSYPSYQERQTLLNAK
jgi:cyclase